MKGQTSSNNNTDHLQPYLSPLAVWALSVYRVGGDEFVAVLQGQDYLSRKDLLQALHDRSVEHISTNEIVISGGLSEYRPGSDSSLHDAFERADALMYEEKKLLKSMGAITREDT